MNNNVSASILTLWWCLGQVKGVGVIALNKLKNNLNDPADLHNINEENCHTIELPLTVYQAWQKILRSPPSSLVQVLEWNDRSDGGVLLAGTTLYPDALNALSDAPIILFYLGDLTALNKYKVAMVGSRNPSYYGQETTMKMAKSLCECGVVVVSGLALGIDGFAHKGALSSGVKSSTIAVLGSGLNSIYPLRHKVLGQTIIGNNGLLLSEYLPNTPPKSHHFPQRNRIISGLSLGVLVVEAQIKSGSLITARLAADQGREVFAVPGQINNPLCKGGHKLIKDGACLVENSEDVMECLNLPYKKQGHTAVANEHIQEPLLTDEQKIIYSFIEYQPVSIDQISSNTLQSISVVTSNLLELELLNFIRYTGSGYIRITH
jgi:DNA processing protein